MNPGIIFAIVTAIAFGIWTVFHQQAANKINYLVGAIIVSLTAVVLGLALLLPRIRTTTLFTDPKGILFAVLAGVCALAIDYFALRAYDSGLAVSVAGPIIIGGSIAIASIIGFFLGESFTWMKFLGLLLVITGSGILAAMTR
ncbi:MAG: EamA family transporter [Nanoarchaeota archaeon]